MKPLAHAAALLVLAFTTSCTVEPGAPAANPPERAPAAAPAEHGDVWFEGSYAEGVAQAKATHKLVFVDFWTTWCGWCKTLDKKTFSQPEVRAQLAKMVALSIDAESPAGKPVAAQFHVTGYPTLLVVDGNGKEVGRIAGFLEPEPFLAKLDEICARAR